MTDRKPKPFPWVWAFFTSAGVNAGLLAAAHHSPAWQGWIAESIVSAVVLCLGCTWGYVAERIFADTRYEPWPEPPRPMKEKGKP